MMEISIIKLFSFSAFSNKVRLFFNIFLTLNQEKYLRHYLREGAKDI